LHPAGLVVLPRRRPLAAKGRPHRERDLPGGLGDLDNSLLLLFKAIRERSTVALSGESADELFAMRSSGSMRLSAAFAGSSEGNGLSVTAIRGRGMGHCLDDASSARDEGREHGRRHRQPFAPGGLSHRRLDVEHRALVGVGQVKLTTD
jgi:asparagine synthetase B (glutamine-hydrolysing)